MADIAIAVVEFEKHKREQQEQRPQQLRALSSASSSQFYHVPQIEQRPQNVQLLVDQSFAGKTVPENFGMAPQSSQQHQQHLPEQQLSLQELNPLPESVFSYTMFLTSGLALWVLYLVLPRGVRKQYFRANRKRYARRMDDNMPAAGYWMPVQSVKAQSNAGVSVAGSYTSTIIAAAAARNLQKNHRKMHSSFPVSVNANTHNRPNPLDMTPLTHSPSSPPRATNHEAALLKHPPSPEHPALKKIPPNKIIAETMARLQGRGIRLLAHGVHCDPKRVWIRLQENKDIASNEPSVTWQTEFPRRVPDQSGNVSIVLMRGSLHSINLKNILYIDVGKKTHALHLTRGVSDTLCMSLLTQNGSLDLQANSKLERDSLVSCFSMILDEIHEEDWRALYEASPEPSLANSSTVVGGYHPSYNNYDTSNATITTPGSSNFKTPSPHVKDAVTTMNNKPSAEERERMLQLL
mmetsp:Transcript_11939/g.28324  ORF Transcript_11939/g.28324 Transcript_11939/m.28324 type:complete len:464 (+) Transcript_11939:172-1563(+)